MTDKPLQLRTVSIRHFLGILNQQQGFSLPTMPERKFSPGVNIIYGANASGKTTSAKAIQELVWTKQDNADKISLAGQWQYEDSLWEKEIYAGHITLLRDGQKTTAPLLPPAEEKSRYLLALPELLYTKDKDLALEIQNELFGGLDLIKAAQELGFQDKTPSTGRLEHKRLQEERRNVHNVQREQDELKKQESKIAELKDKLKRAEHARKLSELYQVLQEYRQLTDDKNRLEKLLASNFPEEISSLTGEEFQRFTEHSESIKELQQKIREQEKRLEELEQILRNSGFDESTCPDKIKLDECREKLQNELEPICRKIPELERECKKLNDALAGETENLGDYASNEKLENIGHRDLTAISHLASDAAGVREREKALNRLEYITTPENDIEETEPEKIRLCLEALIRYASHGENVNVIRLRKALFSLTLTFAASTIAAGIISSLFWLILLLIPAVFTFYLVGTGAGRTDQITQREVEQYFQRAGLEPPSSWDVSAVSDHIKELAETLQHKKGALEKQTFLKTVEGEREELRRKREELENRRRELAEKKGLDLNLEENHWSILARQYCQWRERRNELTEKEAELTEAGKQRDRLLLALQEELKNFTDHPITDLNAVIATLKDLSERSRNYRDARREKEKLIKDTEVLRKELTREEDRRKKICEKAGFDLEQASIAETEQALKTLIDKLPTYTAEKKKLEETIFALDDRRRKLKNYADFDDSMFELSAEEIRVRHQTAENEAKEYGERQKELSQLQAKIERVKEEHRLEDAIAKENEARFQLEQLQRQTAEAVLGSLLIGHLQDTYSQTASRVLRRAKENFANITIHEWELELKQEQAKSEPVFTARETKTGHLRDLDELSSGTRVQLLLAVRLAFIEEMEAGVANLPIILDEALANSDNNRETSVIRALQEIAKAGRQVFYFTAREEEVNRCRDLLNTDPDVEYAIFEMPGTERTSAERDRQAQEHADAWHPSSEKVPEPENRDYFEYAALLRVPELPLHGKTGGKGRDSEAIHLWYLLDDVEVLYRFLQAGYRSWGQVKKLLAHGGADALQVMGIDNREKVKAQLEASAAIIDETLVLRRQGRGRPVTDNVLVNSPFGNHQTLPDLIGCARDVDGDAEKLLGKLENGAVARFGRKSVEKLRDHLTECGCLDERSCIAPDELRARIDARARQLIESGALSAEQYQHLRRLLGNWL